MCLAVCLVISLHIAASTWCLHRSTTRSSERLHALSSGGRWKSSLLRADPSRQLTAGSRATLFAVNEIITTSHSPLLQFPAAKNCFRPPSQSISGRESPYVCKSESWIMNIRSSRLTTVLPTTLIQTTYLNRCLKPASEGLPVVRSGGFLLAANPGAGLFQHPIRHAIVMSA